MFSSIIGNKTIIPAPLLVCDIILELLARALIKENKLIQT